MRFPISLCVSLLLINGEIINGQSTEASSQSMSTTTETIPSTESITPPITTTESKTSSSDPCYDYNTLDEYWREIRQNPYLFNGYDDTLVEWSGWYRLYINGSSAQMSEWCVSNAGCGGRTGLYLNGSHPTLEDGVVTRKVLGTNSWGSSQCGAYSSSSIQVKACPGGYYVYKLVKPIISASMPMYCTVVLQNISSDPCYNYESLDRPWRANNESGDYICDESFSWNGWYRLFYYGMDIQVPETCVGAYSCNTVISLSLSGPHPQIEDGVVIREVCSSYYWSTCCDRKTNPIRVKACPGNYYVYELVSPAWGCSAYCTDVSTISQSVSTISPDIFTGSSITLNYDPCSNYNVLDNHWRSTLNYLSMYGFISYHDDTRVEWDGWYRLFVNESSAQMPEWCASYMSCGGISSLWLGGSHPQLEDGVVTREVYGSRYDQCSHYRSNPIQVKACPGNYYVYKFTRPNLSIPAPVYCAVPFFIPSIDPCYSYTSLDEPWRATDNNYYNNGHYNGKCDYNVEWNGWYRLFYNGQNAQMPQSCLNQGMCGSYEPLWLNGPHPQLEDGIVTRQVCVSSWNGCCASKSHAIRIKACPGNYYVYEFLKPKFCSAYCAEASSQSMSTTTKTIPSIESITPPITITDSSNINITTTTVTPETTTTKTTTTETTTESATSSSDPCYDYNTLDEYWRDIRQSPFLFNGYDDTLVEWSGWYRLFLNGSSAQMSEWCVTYAGCGGETGLYLNGSHPTLEDGVVTREVLGTHSWRWGSSQCGAYSSSSIQVKACPGDYYVYELVKPIISAPMPMYCTVVLQSISSDPCYNYESLDRPWRANNEIGEYICDYHFSWNGWYRLFYYGMDIRMSETCVSSYSCNAAISVWLSDPHPQIEDGVVIREVCGSYHWSTCCDYKLNPIRVKACPGSYYVYELVSPAWGCSAYCTDVSTISQPVSTISPDIFTGSSVTLNYDPCSNYNVLDNHWRSTVNDWPMYGLISYHDDTRVEWDGWYRLIMNGTSAQMPEWCMSYMLCGGFSSLWLGGSHPQLEDGVVTREIYGSRYDQCSRYRSNPIQVKACPGNYYVYKFTRPSLSIPAPVYCAVSFSTPSIDPCYNYTSLDEPWRATDNNYYNNQHYYGKCDNNVEWNGWYRLFYNGQNAQMPQSCVNRGSCGTYESLWLSGPHPQLEDGIVTRQVCLSSYRGCCAYKSHAIKVKACPGNYYVYEFVKPIFCSAYCAESSSQSMSTTTKTIPSTESITPPITTTDSSTINPTITPVIPVTATTEFTTLDTATDVRNRCSELNCTEDEWCGKKNGVYGCLCKKDHHRPQPDSFDFSEICESSSGSMSVSRCQLFEAGFPADALHLNDPSCKGTVRNGRVEFHFDNDEHKCGTNLVANGTHFIYDNFILGTPRSEGLIRRQKILKISFRCAYPQSQTLSMSEINPLESIVHTTGEGRYQVRMIPYEDDEFSRPFTGKVDAELDQEMHVEVRVEGVDSHQFALVMDTCWATPVNDPDYNLRWDLIVSECPNPNDNTVELLQNGVSTSSRFSFRMFVFTANSTKLYLHCAVHLCLLSSNRCAMDCCSGHHRRDTRSLDFHDSASISMGPLVWSESNSDKWIPGQVKVSEASCLCCSLMLLLVPLMSLLTHF